MSSHRIVMIRDDSQRRAPAAVSSVAVAEPLSDALGRIGYDVKMDTQAALGKRRLAPDLIHAFDWAGALSASTVLGGSCPVVVTPDGIAPAPGAVDVIDRVVASSAAQVDELVRLGVPRAKIVRVSSGVDTELFHPGPGLVGKASRRRTPVRVLVVFDATPPAALGQLLQALVRVPDAELVVAGLDRGSDLAKALLEYARQLPGTTSLQLPGQVSPQKLPDLYRSVDVLACLSGTGSTTALQAMSCGVPVVGYATADASEAIVDGVTGILVRPNDLPGLTRALRLLLGDNILRMGMACAATDRIRSRFTWSRVAVEMDQVYQSVLGAGDDAHAAESEAESGSPEPSPGEGEQP